MKYLFALSAILISSSSFAGVSQCSDASANFEALLAQYNNCNNFGGQACASFCSGAATISAGQPQPTPSPTPVDPCMDPQQHWSDLNASSPVQNATVYGHNEDECRNNAGYSDVATQLVNQCNASVACSYLRNCNINLISINVADATPIQHTVSHQTGFNHCNGGATPADIQSCTTQCLNSLDDDKSHDLDKCQQTYPGATCTIAYLSTPSTNNDGRHINCSAITKAVPESGFKVCSATLQATNHGGFDNWGHSHQN